MRVVLANLTGGEGFISKDTVVGGYGSRLRPFSRVTPVISEVKRRFHDVPSVQLAYLAALAARPGHEVRFTRGRARGRRRRHRALVARRSPPRDGVGRRDARTRRAGRIRRLGRVEDAGAVRAHADFLVDGGARGRVRAGCSPGSA